MSTLTCTLSVWQGQLAGNGTMELDSKTGAEYLKTYKEKHKVKPPAVERGALEGEAVLTGMLATHEDGD